MPDNTKDMLLIELKEENKQLREQNEALLALIKEQQELIENLKEQIKFLSDKLFGTSSEKKIITNEAQINLFNEAEVEAQQQETEEDDSVVVKEHTRKAKATHEEMFKGMKVNKIVETLPEEEQICPVCGEQMEVIGETYVRREIMFTPAKCEVNEIYTTSYGCPNCKEGNGDTETATIIKAPVKPALIEKSYATSSLVSRIMYQKYANSIPLNRQEKEWEQYGVKLNRSTMSSWILYCAQNYFKPVFDYFHRELLKREFLMADETRVQVLDEPGRRPETDSFMWVYRTGEDGGDPIILYEYTATRAGDHAAEFLKGFQGYLETDGYQGYNKVPEIKRCSCWAHIRRYFVDAIPNGKQYDMKQPSVQGVSYCDRLSREERSINEKCGGDYEKRKEMRLKKEKPILAAFFAWLETLNPQKGSRLEKAVNYALNRKEAAVRYLEDGRCSFTNNLSENAIRPFAIGRKNWLFAQSVNGAESSALVYTMVEMAKTYSLNVMGYLSFLLESRPSVEWTDEQFAEIAPWGEKAKEFKMK